MIETVPETEKAVLVGLIYSNQSERQTEEYLDELEFLADTAGAVVLKKFTQRLDVPNVSTFVERETGRDRQLYENDRSRHRNF